MAECSRCSGEYCAKHGTHRCRCDILDRHGNEPCPIVDEQIIEDSHTEHRAANPHYIGDDDIIERGPEGAD